MLEAFNKQCGEQQARFCERLILEAKVPEEQQAEMLTLVHHEGLFILDAHLEETICANDRQACEVITARVSVRAPARALCTLGCSHILSLLHHPGRNL